MTYRPYLLQPDTCCTVFCLKELSCKMYRVRAPSAVEKTIDLVPASAKKRILTIFVLILFLVLLQKLKGFGVWSSIFWYRNADTCRPNFMNVFCSWSITVSSDILDCLSKLNVLPRRRLKMLELRRLQVSLMPSLKLLMPLPKSSKIVWKFN